MKNSGTPMQIVEAVEKAIDQVVVTFQENTNRYWNERDLHWLLFHYLSKQEIFDNKQAIDLIRAEFPTRNKYKEDKQKNPSRGHYDLAILNEESLASSDVRNMTPQASWEKFLPLVEVLIAVELKMWPERRSQEQMVELVTWDIRKLTDSENKVRHPYMLNFVQLDFSRPQMREFYVKLHNYLIDQRKPFQDLKILCVPSDTAIQPEPINNWLSLT
jgi:hypothetical protein